METIKHLNLGIMGMSEGNGHPYSWGAIFNGYNQEFMKDCPFPVIPEYLAKQTFPDDAIPNASVSHIWTQDREISEHISRASNIPNIVDHYTDMIGQVDAVLLARDDPENHFEMAKPFLRAGIPIFIDKPLATSKDEAKKMLALEKYPGQLFTCSSLRFAKEFQKSEKIKPILNSVKMIDATIPKSWEKYAVHIIEPVLSLLPDLGFATSVTNTGGEELNIVTVKWGSGHVAIFKVLGKISCPLSIRLFGENNFQELVFKDTYFAFKQSLVCFIKSLRNKTVPIPRSQTLQIIDIIERGFLK